MQVAIIIGIICGILTTLILLFLELQIEIVIPNFLFWIGVSIFTASVESKLEGALKGIGVGLLITVPFVLMVAYINPEGVAIVLFNLLIFGAILGELVGQKEYTKTTVCEPVKQKKKSALF